MITMLDLASEEGAGIEGPGYWCGCYRSVQELVEALRNTEGADLYTHKFWKRCVEFPLYMSRPDRTPSTISPAWNLKSPHSGIIRSSWTALARDSLPRYRMSFGLEEAGDAYCRLSDCLSNDHIAMVRGDATTAYGDYLEKFFRDAVYLKPDCFVIYDDIRALEVRTQRHFQWLLHSELPMVDNEDGTVEIQGENARLVIHPILPVKHNHKFPPPRVSAKGGKEFYCFSLRPVWHHLWNVSPSSSPYPQWDARAKGPLYGRDVQFLVVLSVIQRDEPYSKTIKPFVAENINGVEIASGNEVSKIYFNPHGSHFEMNGITSDGEKVVIRERDGEIISWALVRGRELAYNGRELLNGANAGNFAQT